VLLVTAVDGILLEDDDDDCLLDVDDDLASPESAFGAK
jgi:hypothetical protein